MIRFNCPHCAKAIAVKPELAGRRGKCPGCGQTIQIPAEGSAALAVPSAKQPEPVPPKPAVPAEIPVSPPPSHDMPHVFVPAHPVQVHPPSTHASTTTIHTPTTAVQVNVSQSNAAHSLGISSLVIGILSFFICWIPIIGMPLSGLGLLLGVGGLVMALTRRGSGIGYSIAGSAVNFMGLGLGFVFITVISGMFHAADTAMNELSKQKTQPQATPVLPNDNAGSLPSKNPLSAGGNAGENDVTSAPSVAPPSASKPPEPAWTNMSTPLQLGNVRVQIRKVTVGKVPLFQQIGDRNTESQDDLLTVWIEITNTSEKKKIDYSGWMSDFASLRDIDAELTDDSDNRYRSSRFSGLLKVRDTETNTSIYPGKSIQDAVVFEPPIDGAKYLHLKLSAKGCGEKGEFRFEIPSESIQSQ